MNSHAQRILYRLQRRLTLRPRLPSIAEAVRKISRFSNGSAKRVIIIGRAYATAAIDDNCLAPRHQVVADYTATHVEVAGLSDTLLTSMLVPSARDAGVAVIDAVIELIFRVPYVESFLPDLATDLE